MASNSTWKLEHASRQRAEERGEEIFAMMGWSSPPLDPFEVIRAESKLIHSHGDDFGDYFDGRLSYSGKRFLLLFNTRYDRWPHRGKHHPKVRFTVAHELGHFYLDEHRRFLVQRNQPHGSFTEFQSSPLVEQQADRFAVGLLMPRRLVRRHVNQESNPTIEIVKACASTFDVSLTSMLVRWIAISDFPCSLVAIRNGIIDWGLVSEAFRRNGAFKIRRGTQVRSADATSFLDADAKCSNYREGSGVGVLASWIDWDGPRLHVQEEYAVIPYSQSMLVLFSADEDELPTSEYDHET